MADKNRMENVKRKYRYVAPAEAGDDDLGPLKLLPGLWRSPGRGWNMIALPFAARRPRKAFDFRLLMNQYDEELKFTLVDKGVPNRGIDDDQRRDTDQFLVTLDYEQKINQIAVDDRPESDKRGDLGIAIHHEPGLWLNMLNETTREFDIARLATIPHGNSVLALGRSEETKGPPTIPVLNGLPFGASKTVREEYIEPYQHFIDNPFFGQVTGVPGFPGFHPLDLNAILRFALEADPTPVVRTTKLEVDTENEKAGIVNIPFIERQADATSMKSTFWIQELDATDDAGRPRLRLQYSQVVMLDFLQRSDQLPGRARWPHVSINTLDKVSDAAMS